MQTTRDVHITNWGGNCNNSFVVPKGTWLKIVGGPGGGYAVADVKTATKLCGDPWDAEHRYIFIPEEAVDKRLFRPGD